MADYGIVMKLADIKGNIKVAGHEDTIGVLGIDFSSGAQRVGAGFGAKDSTSVSVSNVNVIIHAGKWTAELFQALYNLKKIGDVEITQLAQAVDKAAAAAPTVLQKIKLTGARLVNVAQTFDGDQDRTASITFEFDKILWELDKKTADFVVRNITDGAK